VSVRQSKTETGRERGAGSVKRGGGEKERQKINVCEREKERKRENVRWKIGVRERDRGGGLVSVNLASRFCVYPLSLCLSVRVCALSPLGGFG